MKAPEKIYFGTQSVSPFYGLTRKCANDDIEYIRTDAFIEKAAKWINEHTSLSEKLVIENFINYMKGE